MGEFKSIDEIVDFLEKRKELNSKDAGVNFNGTWVSEIDMKILRGNKSRLEVECSIERRKVDFNNKIDEIIKMVTEYANLKD